LIGAICGDIIGSVFEWNNIKSQQNIYSKRWMTIHCSGMKII